MVAAVKGTLLSALGLGIIKVYGSAGLALRILDFRVYGGKGVLFLCGGG